MTDNALRELYQGGHPRPLAPPAPLRGRWRLPATRRRAITPLCGDRVTVYLVLDADGRVADIKFEGKGCAISQASASMMTDMLKGRTAADADKLMQGFLHLVKGEDASSLSEDDRERLEVMGGISEFPMRVKCAHAGLAYL